MDKPQKILVTDGEGRSTLAAIRSLGRNGYEVIVTSALSQAIAFASKFCSKGFLVPDPLTASKEYADVVLALASREGAHVILPMTEQSIYALNGLRQRLPQNIVLACAPAAQMHALSDKAALYKLARRLEVDIPQTFFLQSSKDLAPVLEQIEKYPVVVKPVLSRIAVKDGFLTTSISYALNHQDLEKQYAMNQALQYPSLIQEKIIGPGTGLFTLYDKDRHIALFSHRRIREKPPSGGVSVVSESVPLDDEMVEAARRLLSAVGWQGVAMVEFKRDVRDGKAKLMEINGRFWGTLQLAITCGVDFPSLLMDYLQGKKICHQIGDYKVGHRMKWFFGTLDHLLIRLKNDDLDLNLPPNSPSKWGALKEFLKVWAPNTSFDVFDKSDPAPFFHEARLYLRQLVKSRG